MLNKLDIAIDENKKFYNQVSNSINSNAFINRTRLQSVPDSYNKTYYYNDETREKKKKIYKYSILISSAMVAITALLGLRKNKHALESIKKISDNIQHASQNIQEKSLKQIREMISNAMSNAVNIKDDIWDKFAKKAKALHFGIIDKIGDWITGVYKKGITSTFKKEYKKIIENFNDEELNELGITKNFEQWFNQTNDKMYETLHKKGERVTDNLFNKDILGKVTKSNIADEKLKDIYKEEYFDLSQIEDEVAEKKLEELKKLNELKATLLPKMRDINCGSAPTDLLTIIISALGLGIATKNADDKEERKSIMLNLGIPLMATLLSTTYGTVKCFSGAKSLLFGLAFGQVAKIGVKTITKGADKNEKKMA